uniref:Galactokinase n=2 Tax=Trichobilharzia regenti TaxID=157069 RepID=A0AA85IR90_TRIRE|nr:unnamed protein product [Trichobilharzia regenti]
MEGSNFVPVYKPSNIASKLSDEFIRTFGDKPTFVVQAPGRVNLIGEHIDYNGYPVLPMALEQAIHMSAGPTSGTDLGKIVLRSTCSQYKPVKISVEEAITFGSDGPPNPPEWFHYFLCAYRGIKDYVDKSNLNWTPPSMNVLVGDVEYGGLFSAAGLSSSSAFVVASAIAIMQISGLQISRHELASLCAKCEQYIGMQGGGMDQAASVLAVENNALLIQFTKPYVTVSPVQLPADIVFVIAHSGVHARKAATSHYNERVSECRLAAKILAQNSSCSDEISSSASLVPFCLSDAQKAWKAVTPEEMIRVQTDGLSIVTRYLPNGVTTRHELHNLGLSDATIDTCLTLRTKTMDEFRLRDRAEHVYSEAERVYKFYNLCKKTMMSKVTSQCGDSTKVNCTDYMKLLGDLMNDSQLSCAKLYQCSCPELDKLIDICRSAGAFGSRLTGAGWGGCTVSLVKKSEADKFIAEVRSKFYSETDESIGDNNPIFVSQPGRPAGIMFM